MAGTAAVIAPCCASAGTGIGAGLTWVGGLGRFMGAGCNARHTALSQKWECTVAMQSVEKKGYGCESSCLVAEQQHSSDADWQKVLMYAECMPWRILDASATEICLSSFSQELIWSAITALSCSHEQSRITATNVLHLTVG